MDYINLDKWRVLNEKLFKSYIKCYALLSEGKESNPGKAMVKALDDEGILFSITEKDYLSFYTIARELGIFYEDDNGQFVLSDLAKKYNNGELSYSDYLKHYILNSEFLINNEVVHPFNEIADLLKTESLSIDDLAEKCEKCIPVNERGDGSTKKLRAFVNRAIDAGLVAVNDKLYSLVKPFDLIEKSIAKSDLTASEFEEKFIGGGREKQQNIAKQMIERSIPTDIYDGGSSNSAVSQSGSDTKPKIPLNQILFGPPGTGKTYSTVEMALEILEMSSSEPDEQKRREENREIFRSLLNKKIFFVTMHPSYSYEDFVQGIKPKTSDKKELLFEPKDGVFKIVSELAKTLYQDEGEVIDKQVNNKDLLRICFFLSKFDVRKDKKASKHFGAKTYSEAYKVVGEKFHVNPNSINNHKDKFDYLASEERVGWKPQNGSVDFLDNTDLWPYNDVYVELKDLEYDKVVQIVKSIEDKAGKGEERIEENINHVLILDEINRANISKVFGELITLLEEDKRIGQENELSINLPSGEPFSVPPNLYVIGTMNTADKSIALVDIALRRRFQFIPIYPDSAVIKKHGKSEDKDEKAAFMDALNLVLRNDKGVDFQIGHAYFLKDNSLADVINENVIPLLTEYYRNDLKKVRDRMSDIGYPLDEAYYNNTGLLMYKG